MAGNPLAGLSRKKQREPEATKSWYDDRAQTVTVQRNMLAVLALGSLLFAFFAIFMIYVNVPLVTVEPFVVQVDEKSGITRVVDPEALGSLPTPQALQQYFIVRYIQARESYVPIREIFLQNLNTVRLMSNEEEYREYRNAIDPAVPTSYPAQAGPNALRRVRILSINFLSTNYNAIRNDEEVTAQVRVEISERKSREQFETFNQVIVLRYRYTSLNLPPTDRYVNPLGFLVTLYESSEEQL